MVHEPARDVRACLGAAFLLARFSRAEPAERDYMDCTAGISASRAAPVVVIAKEIFEVFNGYTGSILAKWASLGSIM